MSVRRLILLLATLVPLGRGVALAHADFASSEPASGTTITQQLEEVRLVFTEAVELDFSLFKVYELDVAGVDLASQNSWQRLNGLASALVSDVLGNREDGETRVDVGLANDERKSEEIVIALEEGIAAGYYVVMWRILSVDTHGTQGFYVFEYAPQTQP